MENGSTETQTTSDAARMPRGTITNDGDTTAIAKIDKLLCNLTDAERSRVVRFIAEKYEADLGVVA